MTATDGTAEIYHYQITHAAPSGATRHHHYHPAPAMKSQHLTILALTLLLATATPALHAADPAVSNVTATQRAGTKLFDISYDVADADRDTLAISVEISDDGGASFVVPVTALTSGATDPGYPTVSFPVGVTSLTGRTIVWDAAVDYNGLTSSAMKFRVLADDGPVPPGMALIPAGAFEMGDATGAGQSDETDSTGAPTHSVTVSAFYMDKKEVTAALWDSVRAWALANGYTAAGLPDRGAGKGADHPAHTVNWFTVVKWCNARSEKEGLTPVYNNEAGFTTVYRSGQAAPFPDWTADGYRLPTEAEWEKAARGGLAGKNYPWGGDSNSAAADINGGNANFFQSGDPFETGFPDTSPAGYYTPNHFGLHDMAGNMWEWCWDLYNGNWYDDVGATEADTRGPSTASGSRVLRGGSWRSNVSLLRCADRSNNLPVDGSPLFGFRSARGL